MRETFGFRWVLIMPNTIDLLINITCFVDKKKYFFMNQKLLIRAG
jgi:hypothetical protein